MEFYDCFDLSNMVEITLFQFLIQVLRDGYFLSLGTPTLRTQLLGYKKYKCMERPQEGALSNNVN